MQRPSKVGEPAPTSPRDISILIGNIAYSEGEHLCVLPDTTVPGFARRDPCVKSRREHTCSFGRRRPASTGSLLSRRSRSHRRPRSQGSEQCSRSWNVPAGAGQAKIACAAIDQHSRRASQRLGSELCRIESDDTQRQFEFNNMALCPNDAGAGGSRLGESASAVWPSLIKRAQSERA